MTRASATARSNRPGSSASPGAAMRTSHGIASAANAAATASAASTETKASPARRRVAAGPSCASRRARGGTNAPWTPPAASPRAQQAHQPQRHEERVRRAAGAEQRRRRRGARVAERPARQRQPRDQRARAQQAHGFVPGARAAGTAPEREGPHRPPDRGEADEARLDARRARPQRVPGPRRERAGRPARRGRTPHGREVRAPRDRDRGTAAVEAAAGEVEVRGVEVRHQPPGRAVVQRRVVARARGARPGAVGVALGERYGRQAQQVREPREVLVHAPHRADEVERPVVGPRHPEQPRRVAVGEERRLRPQVVPPTSRGRRGAPRPARRRARAAPGTPPPPRAPQHGGRSARTSAVSSANPPRLARPAGSGAAPRRSRATRRRSSHSETKRSYGGCAET